MRSYYLTEHRKAKEKIDKMPTKKLLVARKTYNPEFKRYSAKVLRERGVKLRKKVRRTNQAFGFNLWR